MVTSARWVEWSAVLDEARAAPVERRCALSAAVCLAALRICKESLTKDRMGGFPRGRPDTATTRAAAQLLRESNTTAVGPGGAGYRTLGLLMLLHGAKASTDGAVGDERLAALENLRRACAEVDPSDPLLIALCRFLLAGRLATVLDHVHAVEEFDNALVALESVDLFGSDHWLCRDVPFLAADAGPGIGYRIALLTQLHKITRLLDIGRVAAASQAADVLVGFTRNRLPENTGDYGWALARRARVERELRAVPAFMATERELRDLVGRLPEGPSKRALSLYWWGVAADNASKLGDYMRSNEYLRQRISFRARRDLGIETVPAALDPTAIGKIVAGYHRVGSDPANIGNDVYDLALNMFNAGLLQDDPVARRQALELLALAKEAWKNFAVNGLFSVWLSRTRIEILQGGDLDEATDTFLRVNARASRYNTKRRALVAAVRYGTVASTAVLDRLTSLIDALDPPQHQIEGAHLYGLLAEFWLRTCTAEAAAGGDPRWDTAREVAARAAVLLRPGGVSLDPELEAVVWQTTAAATRDGGRARLEAQLRAISCVAELMVTVSTTADRSRLAERFAPLFADAAAMAVTLGDHDAADLIMEAVRRDRVGLLLAELVADPTIADTIRAAALAVADSSRRAPDDPRSAADDGSDDEENGDTAAPIDLTTRAAVILADRAYATTEAERVLGPLGALCDPQLLRRITARGVLKQRANVGTAAVLQLLAVTAGANTGDAIVYRRLTVARGTQIDEHLDAVRVPRRLLAGRAGDAKLFRSAATYARALLPEPLNRLCADAEEPVRLLVIPTGFFQVPFDCLPVGDSMLIDKAVVSLHGSLTGMHSLLRIERVPRNRPSLAVYDKALLHTEAEYRCLVDHVDNVRRVYSATELDTALQPIPDGGTSLLAMGVHGTADERGWGQTKIMPDGSQVTAADVLRWQVPQLCVLASCNTGLTTVDGIELGGFPLALMLRGATTVIGGLFDISDESTAEIMRYFWVALGRGVEPVRALREAKLAWLQAHPRRPNPRLWAGLITYGAAHG
ncbi:CHAT domain-containing protein [Nocardia thailandica]|uniref:CHAT domain-containing protein n=1 Tax=Nocardia thailandica TaxID=257275 RepID=A0ABW6PNZ8_9NOCA